MILLRLGMMRGLVITLAVKRGGGGNPVRIRLRVIIAAILWILGQPQTASLALPQNLQKAPLAIPQILES